MRKMTIQKITKFNDDFKFFSSVRDVNLEKFTKECKQVLPNITNEEINKKFWKSVNKLANSNKWGCELARELLDHFIYHDEVIQDKIKNY
jgi:hypothetical protein